MDRLLSFMFMFRIMVIVIKVFRVCSLVELGFVGIFGLVRCIMMFGCIKLVLVLSINIFLRWLINVMESVIMCFLLLECIGKCVSLFLYCWYCFWLVFFFLWWKVLFGNYKIEIVRLLIFSGRGWWVSYVCKVLIFLFCNGFVMVMYLFS